MPLSAVWAALLLHAVSSAASGGSGARLLRQPDISATEVVFIYAGDIWTASRSGSNVRRLTKTPEAESYPRFSPDGRLIAFTRLGDVYVIPPAGGQGRRLTWHPQYDSAAGWTPGGRRIVMHSERWKGAWDVSPHVFLLPAEGGWPEPLPVPRAMRASFAPDGRRFAYGPFFEVPLIQSWRQYRGGALGYIAIHDAASKAYEELPRGEWNDVSPLWCGAAICFLSDRDGTMNLYRYSPGAKTAARLTAYTEWDVLNPGAAGDAIVYENGGWLYLLDLATGASRQLAITLPAEALPTASDAAVWQQTVEDAWRIYQERAFAPATVWKHVKARYLDLMKSAAHWSDADAVLRQMLAEAGQSHIGRPRAEPEAPPAKTGLLGADFRLENGRYRITKILRGDGDKAAAGPLAAPGLGVRDGDYVLAVNGAAIAGSVDIYSHFVGLAGGEARLSVAEAPAAAPREVMVRPIADETLLRYQDWVRRNRERVAAATGARTGYVHLFDADKASVDQFRSECRAMAGKVDGLIVDVRDNNGGNFPLEIIGMIERPPPRMMFERRGQVPPFASPFIDGPKVMLANERSVSGGDELAFYFQSRKLGPLVGTRTMGAMIGAGAYYPVAGGWKLAVPEFGFFVPESGQWHAENRGIAPDYRVEWRPADYAAGRDPQLEKAIELVVAAVPGYRKLIPEIPPYRPAR